MQQACCARAELLAKSLLFTCALQAALLHRHTYAHPVTLPYIINLHSGAGKILSPAITRARILTRRVALDLSACQLHVVTQRGVWKALKQRIRVRACILLLLLLLLLLPLLELLGFALAQHSLEICRRHNTASQWSGSSAGAHMRALVLLLLLMASSLRPPASLPLLHSPTSPAQPFRLHRTQTYQPRE
jgi:hypothetical protein